MFNKEYSWKAIVVIIVMAAIAASGGYYAGVVKGKKISEAVFRDSFSSISLFSLSGVITDISNDKKSISVEMYDTAGIRLPEGYRGKTIMIDNDTKIVALREKEQSLFSTEEKQMLEARNKGAIFAVPIPYTEEEVSADALVVGAEIDFMPKPSDVRNILDKQFSVTRITIKSSQ